MKNVSFILPSAHTVTAQALKIQIIILRRLAIPQLSTPRDQSKEFPLIARHGQPPCPKGTQDLQLIQGQKYGRRAVKLRFRRIAFFLRILMSPKRLRETKRLDFTISF